MNQVLDSASQRDKVRRLIIEPLAGRGEPPKGWTREAIFADYVGALGGFPEAVLEEAARKVRASHQRSTWPLPGDFLAACKPLLADEPRSRATGDDKDATRTVTARDYVSKRMAANNSSLFLRCNAQGPWFKSRVEAFLMERAFACIDGNRPIHIANADLEAEMIALEPEAVEYRRSALEALAGPRSSKGHGPRQLGTLRPIHITNPETQRLVDQARGTEPPMVRSEGDYGKAGSDAA